MVKEFDKLHKVEVLNDCCLQVDLWGDGKLQTIVDMVWR